jgi:lipopolysaccharide assembly outer membrane protein LptD (OstA)
MTGYRLQVTGYRFILFLVTGYWLLVTLGYAQQQEPLVVNGDQVEYFPEEKKIVGEGNVVITYKGMRLTCDKIEVFTETKDTVAQGNVRLYQDGAVFTGEKVYYNFENKQGRVINITMQGVGPWYGRGDLAEKAPENKYSIENGYMTTCDREKPHYRIMSKRIEVFLDEKVVARDVVFKVGPVPLFYLPYCAYSFKEKYPHFIFVPGYSKKWGLYMFTSWRYSLSENLPGRLHLDYRQKKGFAHGIDQDYITENFGQGRLRYYYMEEHDKAKPKDLRTETQRYRLQLKHRWEMTDNTLAMLEYHRLSDRNFLKDYYFREEYEKEHHPKSYLSVISAHPNYSLSGLVRKRTNRFFTETERLPEISLDIKSQRIKDTSFYYKSDFSFANLTNKNASSDVDDDVRRTDSYNQLSYVTRLGFLSIAPYVASRQTYYSKDKFGDEDKFRGIFYSGLDASTKFYKTYDIKSNFWNLDLNQLHHIITPTLNYKYIHRPTLLAQNLMSFDSIDSISRDNTVTLGLENKLQTKRKDKDAFKTVELGTFLFTGDYNFKPEVGSQWSNFKFDLELTPYDWLRIESDATYNPPSRDFRTVNFDFVASHKELWSFGLGSRYEENSIHELTNQFIYNVNPRWQFRAYQRYDFKKIEGALKRTNDFVEQEYAIIRDLHCWSGEFVLNIKDGYSFWVIFRLKAFPEVPFKFSTRYRAPKTTSY